MRDRNKKGKQIASQDYPAKKLLATYSTGSIGYYVSVHQNTIPAG